MAIGFLCGLACLIRPTEIICLMVPIVWGISRCSEVRNIIKLFLTQRKNILAATLIFISIGAIQLIYWKWATGDWLVYSYQEQGFSWLRPHFFAYNFSYKSGWLRYCPMMLLPFLGIYPLYKYRLNFFAVTGMMLLSWYIVTAWDIWDYGGRAMVQYYPFFAIALAAYLLWIKGIKILKILTALFMLLSLYLNIWWVYHAHKGEVLVSNLTKAYYQRMVGRWHSTDDDTKLLDNEYSYRGVMKNKQLIYENNFDTDSSANYVNVAGNGMLILNDLLHQTVNYIVKAPLQKQAWIRAYTTFHTGIKEWNEWQQTQFIINFYNENSIVQTNQIRIHRLVGDNDHKEIYIDGKCPKKWTYLSIDYQNFQSDKEVKMDSLKVFTFSDN